MWCILAALDSIKCNFKILHFFYNHICPKGGVSMFVNHQSNINLRWQREDMLVCHFHVFGVILLYKQPIL